MAVRSASPGETTLNKVNSTIAIALCTSAALIAFAFDQRYQQHVSVSSAEFFVAAAAICLAPALYAQ